MIGRGGVGLDNIDVEFAESKGIIVFNTPAASSQAVAELAFGHMFNLARFMHQANRNMALNGTTTFDTLKKDYGSGIQLRGKSDTGSSYRLTGREHRQWTGFETVVWDKKL